MRKMPALSQVGGRCLPWFQMVVFALPCSLQAHLCFLTSQESGVQIPATTAAMGSTSSSNHPGQPSSVKWAAQAHPPGNQTATAHGGLPSKQDSCHQLGPSAHARPHRSPFPWLRLDSLVASALDISHLMPQSKSGVHFPSTKARAGTWEGPGHRAERLLLSLARAVLQEMAAASPQDKWPFSALSLGLR